MSVLGDVHIAGSKTVDDWHFSVRTLRLVAIKTSGKKRSVGISFHASRSDISSRSR
jgi:hypothetical protein